MPQIPLGDPQQVVRGGQAVEAINPREERLFGNALSSLGGTLQKLKQENERMALTAGKEEYERESYRLLLKAQQEYNSMDTTGLSFDDYVKPQLESVKQNLKSKYKIQDDNAWIGVTFGVENSLVPRFMAQEAKSAIEMQQQIEANRAANMAQRILEAENPLVEMGGYFAKNAQLVDEGVAAGTYLPEQRDAVIAQKNATTVIATIDALTSREKPDYKTAIEVLKNGRQFFDQETFRKEMDRLNREWSEFENRAYTISQRERAEQERVLKERQEAAERVLATEREKIANNPQKIAEWNKKVEAAYAARDLTIEQRNRLYTYNPFQGGNQDDFIAQKMYGDLASGKLTVSGALKQLDTPAMKGRLSLEGHETLKSRLLSLREAEKDRGEKFEIAATKDMVGSIGAKIRSTPEYALNPKLYEALIADITAQVSTRQAQLAATGRTITEQERNEIVRTTAARYNIPVLPQSLRLTPIVPGRLDQLNKKLADIKKRAQRPGLTEEQKRAFIQEIMQTQSEIESVKREQGVR